MTTNHPDEYTITLQGEDVPWCSRTGEYHFSTNRAMAIARNVAKRYGKTATLKRWDGKPHPLLPRDSELPGMWENADLIGGQTDVEDVTDNESPYDRVVNYVDSLKGPRLAIALQEHNLPVGSDPVASKRQRLIAYLVRN